MIENEIATLKADLTRKPPELLALLQKLGNKAEAIPFYAIFPANNPNQPILFAGTYYSPGPVLDKFRLAVPSQNTTAMVDSGE